MGDTSASTSRVNQLRDEVSRLLAARRLQKSRDDTDSTIFSVSLCYEQNFYIPSALLSDCVHLRGDLHIQKNAAHQSNLTKIFDIADFCNQTGARAMMSFIYGQKLDHKASQERPHRFYTDCFEAAYSYQFENFASSIVIQYANYVQSSEPKDLWTQDTLDDFLCTVKKFTGEFEIDYDPGYVPKQYSQMKDILLWCAVVHARQVFSNRDQIKDMIDYDPEFAARLIQALSTRTLLPPDPLSLLQDFTAKQGINLTYAIADTL